jgi:hypothetical protein
MRRSARRQRIVCLSLVSVCAAALAACGGGSERGDTGISTHKVIRLTGQPQHVLLPAHKTYGIYVKDANNSGYTLGCSATDAHGGKVHMKSHTPATISNSPTNNLDEVYNTGSGDLTFTCAAPGEQTTTRLLSGVIP